MQAFNTHESDNNISDEINKKNIEIKKLQDGLQFQKQQEKFHIEELQSAVQQERSQTLNMMEKLNDEKQSKSDLQEEVFLLRDGVHLVKYLDNLDLQNMQKLSKVTSASR